MIGGPGNGRTFNHLFGLMHFSKTYAQLLLTLPHELQQNAIAYRQLKKHINGVASELASLGLSPAVLQSLFEQNETELGPNDKGKRRAFGERPVEDFGLEHDEDDLNDPASTVSHTKAVYEVVQHGERLQPRLRIWVGSESESSIMEETEEGNTASRVIIQLDKPDSPTETRPAGPEDITDSYFTGREMLLVSKPIVSVPGQSLVWSLQRKAAPFESECSIPSDACCDVSETKPPAHPVGLVERRVQLTSDGTRELVIPLVSDTAFFELLYSALETLASHLLIVRANFIERLKALAVSISHTAIPQHCSSSHFHPNSRLSDPTTSPLSPFSTSFIPGGKSKSDLYAWREIFQLYIDSEVFESMKEADRGERDIGEAEERLTLFAERVTGRGLNDERQLKLRESRDALETFLQLNVLIVNLKKFQFANAEAARKILKKHAKRTALPFPIPRLDSASSPTNSKVFSILSTSSSAQGRPARDLLALIPSVTSFPGSTSSIAHLLVQAIGEVVLPIIPHIDDYSCLICTSIAFKPIRLSCGHLFCVRCLVKMQKRGQDHCPCCRTPCVIQADRRNVDWAMMNFMQDWFPREAAEKLKQNEKEALMEEMEALGFQDQKCIIC